MPGYTEIRVGYAITQMKVRVKNKIVFPLWREVGRLTRKLVLVDGCTCSEFLGVDSGEVDKLLLVDTNKGLIQGIDDAILLLGQIKDTVKLYDPNTKLLEADIVDWIVYLQTFITDSINPFSDSNLQLLTELKALTVRRSLKLLKP